MICRHFTKGEKLNVADLNEITVLIDRTETELTEVALNTWPPGLDGPPHFHNEKDQIFYITSGMGTVMLGEEKCSVEAGHLLYVPAGLTHKTVATTGEPLCYVFFNFFLNPDKEGHSSFADHIEKVKLIRKRQAESGRAVLNDTDVAIPPANPGKHIDDIGKGKLYESGSNTTRLLLERTETNRCEAVVVTWPKGSRGVMVAHKEKEQTFFVLSGSGRVIIGDEQATVKPGDVIFVPRNTPHTTETLNAELSYLCLNMYIGALVDKFGAN